MDIFKFGGASIQNGQAIKNIKQIVEPYKQGKLLIVVSAMGKATNALEALVHAFYQESPDADRLFTEIKAFHFNVIRDLFPDPGHPIYDEVNNTFVEIDWILEDGPLDGFDYLYDQIVSIGELVSSKIVAAFLKDQGLPVRWIDARNYVQTDNNFRDAGVDWEKTEYQIQQTLPALLEHHILLTQGFIGSTSENFTTTLGREGSDYTAAIFAACLNAESATIWKDVPGVLNADPKWFSSTELIPELSYRDAIELTYYGATVIHPKTIKPLENKEIPLFVRSFSDLSNQGTCIRRSQESLPVPSFIFKVNQVLISILPKDFSFILEDNLSHIFNLFHKHKVKINMMHNSAVSFSVSSDFDPQKITPLTDELKRRFDVTIQKNLELVTIRYFNQQTIDRVLVNKKIILEVKDSYTCQMLIKDIDQPA